MASRSLAVAALIVLLVGVVASPAGAKEGVVARVVTPISRDAEPGSKVTRRLDAHLRRGRQGALSPRAHAAKPAPGRFRATVRVPRGGVSRVEFGIVGTACDQEGCRASPKLFPIVGRVFR
jgi:hypothetical protein